MQTLAQPAQLSKFQQRGEIYRQLDITKEMGRAATELLCGLVPTQPGDSEETYALRMKIGSLCKILEPTFDTTEELTIALAEIG